MAMAPKSVVDKFIEGLVAEAAEERDAQLRIADDAERELTERFGLEDAMRFSGPLRDLAWLSYNVRLEKITALEARGRLFSGISDSDIRQGFLDDMHGSASSRLTAK